MTMHQRRMREQRGEGGFTLIELLVVIIILGVLSAVVVFAVRGTGDKGKTAAFATDAKTIRTAEEAFCGKFGKYGTAQELVDQKFLSELPTLHTALPAPGGPCKGANEPNKSAFSLYCPVTDTSCTSSGGADNIPQGLVRLSAPQAQNKGQWGERLASAGLPPALGGNIQGGDLNGDGVPDYFVSSTKSNSTGDANANPLGRVWAMSGKDRTVLYTIDSPSPQKGKNFGFFIQAFGDVNGDGKTDIAVGTDAQSIPGPGGTCGNNATTGDAPSEAVTAPNSCNEGQGRVWVFNGANGAMLYGIDNPVPQGRVGNSARFGSRLGRAGDVNGDGVAELIAGASNNDVCGTAACTAAVAAAQATPGTQAAAGDLACGDVNPFPDGCRTNQGQAFIFNGADGTLIRTLDMPANDVFNGALATPVDGITCKSSCGAFGLSVQGPGDVDGDGKTDQLVDAGSWAFYTGTGAPCGAAEPNGCNETQGRMYLFSGATGALMARFDDPSPQSNVNWGFQDAAPLSPGDVNGDGTSDIYANGFTQNVPATDTTGNGAMVGGATVFDGKAAVAAYKTSGGTTPGHAGFKVTDGTVENMLYHVTDPTPTRGAQFGWTMATTDHDLDGKPDLIIGSSPHALSGPVPNEDGGTAVIKGQSATYGSTVDLGGSPTGTNVLKVLDLDTQNATGQISNGFANLGANLGWGIAALGDINGDRYPDYGVGAPFWDNGTANVNQGMVLNFLSRSYCTTLPDDPKCPAPGV